MSIRSHMFNQLAIVSLLLAPAISSTAEEDDERKIDEADEVIVVSASRVERKVEDIASTASVIDEEQMERYLNQDIQDLVRYEPGVSVSGGGRFGLAGFRVRGIEGDRIRTQIDGVPVADEFSFGPNLSAQRDFIDIDALKAVEIVRGPTSSLYGSDAIGGTVSFVTKDPMDYLGIHSDSYYASYKIGYYSDNDGLDHSFTVVGGDDVFSGMFIGTLRDGEETESFFGGDQNGPGRSAANPQDFSNLNYYGKLVWQPSDAHQFKLILDQFSAEVDTDLLSQAGTVVFGTVKDSVTGEDERERSRVALQYRFERQRFDGGTSSGGLFDHAYLNLYSQRSETDQFTFEQRTAPGNVGQIRNRDSSYQQDNIGLNAQFDLSIEGDVSHHIIYGLDWDKKESETLRTGNTALLDGTPVPEFSNFPTRDFPNSEYVSYGVFFQDEIRFSDDRFSVIPSLRYDNFDLDPKVDAIYLAGNTGSPVPEGYEESKVSGKLGLIYRFNDRWSIFGQYAEGFKAPPLDAVNTGFTNFAGGYTTLPNPDLEPESSVGLEVGVRYYSKTSFFEAALYENRYDDFIEALAFRGFNPATGLLEFQARNLDETTIKGLELKGGINLAATSKSLEGLSLRYAYAYADGEDEETGEPLNTIDPQQLVTGLSFDNSNETLGMELAWTLTDRQDEIDATGLGGPAAFEAPGNGIFDLVGYYRFSDRARLNFGLFNLTDKQYWRSGDIGLRDADDDGLERLTRPGRNYSVTFKYEF